MRRLSQFVLLLLLVTSAIAKPRTFEAGLFSVTADLDPDLWSVDPHPERDFVRFFKLGTSGLAGRPLFEATVYVDRITDSALPQKLEDWFVDYLRRTSAHIERGEVDVTRSFRIAKDSPVTIAGRKFIRFDLVRFPITKSRSPVIIEEEGAVYFLVLPQIEKHRLFFVFVARQWLSRDFGHRSELGEIEHIIRGFQIPSKKG